MWFAVRGRRFAFGEKRDALSCLVGEAGSFPPLAGEGLKAPPNREDSRAWVVAKDYRIGLPHTSQRGVFRSIGRR